MKFLPMLPSGNENFKRESNPMPWLLYLYLSASTFLVSFTAPNKQSFSGKSVFKPLDHLSNSYTINKFTALFGVKGAVSSCSKQLPSNHNLRLDLFHSSFRERLLFAVKGGLNFLFDNPSDFHFFILALFTSF